MVTPQALYAACGGHFLVRCAALAGLRPANVAHHTPLRSAAGAEASETGKSEELLFMLFSALEESYVRALPVNVLDILVNLQNTVDRTVSFKV